MGCGIRRRYLLISGNIYNRLVVLLLKNRYSFCLRASGGSEFWGGFEAVG